MRAVWMLAGSDLRRRWRSVIVLTLFVGVAGAVVLALVAGARRTESSALARFERSTPVTASVEIHGRGGHRTPSPRRACAGPRGWPRSACSTSSTRGHRRR